MNDSGDAPEVWVVDRVDGAVAVLVAQDTEIVVQVQAELLGADAVEGAVLLVPLGDVGEPIWAEAERDEEAEARFRADAEETIERLKKRDPGGNVAL